MKRLGRLLTSLRTTAVLLCLLALLLLLNVIVPQASVMGEDLIAAMANASRWNHFVLVTLDLGHLTTSALFLTALGLFFFQLAIVLVHRAGPTFRRIRMHPRSKAGLEAWAHAEEGHSGRLPEGWDLALATRTLRGYGYRVKRIDEKILWGVKHRTAPLGFLLFHLSFFLMCAGGLLLYYTRFAGTAVLVEGETFSGDYQQVLRQPAWGEVPRPTFTLQSVDPHMEQGEPTHLGAVFRFHQGGTVVERGARINEPAAWGAVRVLVQRTGLAPVFWLQDGRGFTLDRVTVVARVQGEEITEVPMADGRYLAQMFPLESDQTFPRREELPIAPLRLRVLRSSSDTEGSQEEKILFEGSLRQGGSAAWSDGRLVLEELRLWVSVLVVSERGGGWLIAGFLLGVAGLVWRLLLHRREVALLWDQKTFRLVGRSESYPWRFQEELETISDTLLHGGHPTTAWQAEQPAPQGQ